MIASRSPNHLDSGYDEVTPNKGTDLYDEQNVKPSHCFEFKFETNTGAHGEHPLQPVSAN